MALNPHAAEVRNVLCDAVKLCRALGLTEGAQRQARGLLVRCPSHAERTPSCSVTPGPDGTLRVRCFACDFSGDALTLIATVRGRSLRIADDFREVLAEGAEIGGHLGLAAEIRDGQAAPERKPVPRPSMPPERDYPPQGEVSALWLAGGSPSDDVEASGYLVRRRLDPELVAARGLARTLAAPLPWWASYQRRSWAETGHRLIVRAFDANGRLRSLRSIRVRDGESPKRLPAIGKAAGLVLANLAAWRLLRGESPARVVVVEGEPDFLSHATHFEDPVIGIVNGSWSPAFAAAIPRGARVIIRTHADAMGDKYAEQITESLNGRCDIRRSEPEAA